MNLENDNKELSQQIKQDLKLSVLSGPLTTIIPILSYAFLYPIILLRTNIEVLGLWSLYVTTASFFTVADFGFSQHFIREATQEKTSDELATIKLELFSARRFYFILGVIIILTILALNEVLFKSTEKIYPSSGLLFSALVIVLGAIILLISSLDSAILSARADNYFVRLIRSISPLFTYGMAVTGALLSYPIEGFAIGFLISNIFLVVVYQLRLKVKHKDWHGINISVSINESLSSIRLMLQKTWRLYSVSIGMLIRQPIVRYVIAITLGLSSAGAFDIAMRVTTAIRDLVAAGFNPLYPSLSYFYKKNERDKIIRVIRISLFILIPFGVISTVLLISYAEILYKFWLKEIPPETLSATFILMVWQFMTLINLPFWHLLLASHNEKIAAISIWVHTVSILLIIPFEALGIHFTVYSLLVYWTSTAILTQFLIYYFVEKKMSLFNVIFKNKQMIVIIVINIFYLIIVGIFSKLFRGIWIIEEFNFSIPYPDRLLLTLILIILLLPYYLKIFKQHKE
jgi:O-antigen/teichoic acid export membrane protein